MSDDIGDYKWDRSKWVKMTTYSAAVIEIDQLKARAEAAEAQLKGVVAEWDSQRGLDALALEQTTKKLEAAERELDELGVLLNAARDICAAQANAALARESVLREALEFYAKVWNWDNCFRSDLGTYVPANTEGSSDVEMDRGKRARAALAANAHARGGGK